jgi:hypothetical protein
MGVQSVSTSVKIRFPRETLAALDDWAAVNHIPRSVAVRRLILRSMVNWRTIIRHGAPARAAPEPAQRIVSSSAKPLSNPQLTTPSGNYFRAGFRGS